MISIFIFSDSQNLEQFYRFFMRYFGPQCYSHAKVSFSEKNYGIALKMNEKPYKTTSFPVQVHQNSYV